MRSRKIGKIALDAQDLSQGLWWKLLWKDGGGAGEKQVLP